MDNNNSSNTHLMSDDIRQLAQAYLQAKIGMGSAKKNSKSNLHKYANLLAVYEAVEEALHANNIFIWHFAEALPDDVTILHTRLIHAPTGQYVQDSRPLKSEKPGNQAVGSANTYMRRYAVLSLCALDTDDDDGEGERKHIETQQEVQITPEHVEELKALIRADTDADATLRKIKSFNKVNSITDLTEYQYRGIMKNQFKK